MSAFMVHPQGCNSRGKDPLKKVPVWQGVGVEADTPRSSQENWSLLGKNGGEHSCLQRGHMEGVVRVWSLERWWMHKLSTSRWVFKTKHGGLSVSVRTSWSCIWTSHFFHLTAIWGILLDQAWIGTLGQAYTVVPFAVGTEAEAWEEESHVLVSVWLLSYCLIFSSSHHLPCLLILHLENEVGH